MADMSSTKSKKQSKKKRKHSHSEGSGNEMMDVIPEPADTEFPKKKVKAESSEGSASEAFETGQWPAEKLTELVNAVNQQIPAGNDETCKELMSKINWTKINIPSENSLTCKKKFTSVMTKIRSERNMREMLEALSDNINKGTEYLMAPKAPKMPQTVFLRFSMARSAKIRKKWPEMKFAEIQKKISAEFKVLSAEKKAKYQAEYNADMKKYTDEVAAWEEQYPRPNQYPQITCPKKIFVDEKMQNPGNTLSRSELGVQWDQLKDRKKCRYFNRAIEAKREFDEQIKQMQENGFMLPPQAHNVGFLTKREWEIKDAIDGKPEAPQKNGFNLFFHEYDGSVPSGLSKMQHIRNLWKNMDAAKLSDYRKRAKELNNEYMEKMEDFLESLSDEQHAVHEERHQLYLKTLEPKEKEQKTTPKRAVKKKKKEDDGTLLKKYITLKYEFYKKRHPEMEDEELIDAITKDYDNLSETQKAEFQEVSAVKKKIKEKKRKFPGEPERPPGSAYGVFTKEILLKNMDKPGGHEWMAHVGQQWKTADKDLYQKRYSKCLKKFQKEAEIFIKTLSQEDAQAYCSQYSHMLKEKGAGDHADNNRPRRTSLSKNTARNGHLAGAIMQDSDNEDDFIVNKTPSRPTAKAAKKGKSVRLSLPQKSESSSDSESEDDAAMATHPVNLSQPKIEPQSGSSSDSNSSDESETEIKETPAKHQTHSKQSTPLPKSNLKRTIPSSVASESADKLTLSAAKSARKTRKPSSSASGSDSDDQVVVAKRSPRKQAPVKVIGHVKFVPSSSESERIPPSGTPAGRMVTTRRKTAKMPLSLEVPSDSSESDSDSVPEAPPSVKRKPVSSSSSESSDSD